MSASTFPPTNGAGSAPYAAGMAARDGAPGSLLLQFAAMLARGRRKAVSIVVATTAAGALAAALLPKSYVAGTLLVPFSGSSRRGVAMAALPAGLSGLIGAVGGGSPAERILAPVLTSSTLYDTVMNRVTAGGAASRPVVDEVLRKGIRVARNGDGSILIQVRAPEPNLAARIANIYPGAINDILSRVSAEGSRTKQQFLRAQLDSAEVRLSESERRYVEFAQRRAAPAAEQQAQRTLDAAAALQQGIFEQETAVAQLRRTATPENAELRAAEAQLASRRDQLRRLTNGGGSGTSVFVPIQRGPELRVASSRVERDYQQDQRVYSSLAAAVTDAQIDVSNSLPVLTVLDPARPPGGPQITVWDAAALSFGFGLIVAFVTVFVADVLERLRADPANAPALATFARTRVRVGAAHG